MGTLLLIMLALYGTLAGQREADPAPQATTPEVEGEAPPGAGSGGPMPMLVVGDSLAQATEGPLAGLLPDWRIETSASRGRHIDDGVAEIVSRSNLPDVIVVSLGTNDNPSETESFAAHVQRVLDAAGPSRCVVWANISRPPYAGVSYSGYNHELARFSFANPNLIVVDWAGISHSQPGLLGSDGVHATSQGYAVRAQAIASAVTSCGGVQSFGGAGTGVPGD
jgi:hypothetical protein